MKLAVSLAGLTLCGGLLATSFAEDTKPAAKPADPHFIEPGELFFISFPENYHKKGTIYLGYKTDSDVENAGATKFRDFTDRTWESKVFYRTRPAKPEDLYIGRRIIYPGSKIESRARVEEGFTWRFGSISSLAEVKDLKKGVGELTVAGNDPADLANGVRVIVGDKEKDPEVKLTGSEDKHFFHPEHWLIFIGRGEPEPDGNEVKMAVQLRAPEKAGEAGTYLRLDTGDIVTTKYAYKSRPVNKGELKAGLRIALPERAVEQRFQAYSYTWWIGALTSYDQHGVAKVGNHTVSVRDMRAVP